MLTTRTHVVLAARVWSVLCVLGLGCAERRHAPLYESRATSSAPDAQGACSVAATGCPCDSPGALADCGELVARTDSYVTCMQGVRVCSDRGTWGECGGDLVTRALPQPDGKAALALGAVSTCNEQNPCDPFCRQIVDTGVGVTGLADGLCSTASGIVICRTCGYTGPVADLPYASLPEQWRRVPPACVPADDRCPMDTVCVAGSCQARAQSCAAPEGTCAVDLTLAKPCIDAGSVYHVPLCNRGSTALTTGTIRIGVDSRSQAISECAVVPADRLPGFPDSGVISYTLSAGQRIEPGTCVDVHPDNSQAMALDLSGNRAFVANYDLQSAECNTCNNASALIVASDTGEISQCTPCVGLECNQIAATTSLRGVVYDPAGIRPLPGVIVYVAASQVAPLVDGVTCDTCDALVSGSPLVSTTTDDTGHFVLSDMPSDVPLQLVIQIGRWRRQVTVAPIPSATTRWVAGYDPGVARFNVSADELEPAPVAPELRLRLPRTQRRCNSQICAGEGDIPKIALVMADADPLQCTLRRIGVADSEFTNDWSYGRVHLFEASGMWQFGMRMAYGSETALLRSKRGDGEPMLKAYSMLLAPCDVAPALTAHSENSYRTSAYASGPSYNAGPAAVTSELERKTVKDFVDAGGRLLTTDWMSMDLVHLNYDPPPPARFGTSNTAPLSSPYDSSSDPAFSAELEAYTSTSPGFGWSYVPAISYSPSTPALYLFGNNVERGSAQAHDPALAASERFPSIAYDIDQSSALGASFGVWAEIVGANASSEAGRIRWREWSPRVHAVRTTRGALPLLRGDSRDPSRFEWLEASATRTGPVAQQPCLQGAGASHDCTSGAAWGDEHVAMFQLDAPIGAAQQCGKIGVTSGHVSQHVCYAPSLARGQPYCDPNFASKPGAPVPDCGCFSFPHFADQACGSRDQMSEEEKAFEFLFFSTSRCVGEMRQPARAVRLARAAATRDFEANCAADEQVIWQLFSWQATIPEGTRIEFFAATANTQTELEQADYVAIGVADQTTTTWTASEHTVDQFLRLARSGPLVSQRWLRLKSYFVPNGAESPTLGEWRVVFNCR